MRVCIVGGGKIGFYLSKTLLEHGHQPVVIEQNAVSCRNLANSLDIPVIQGDGTTMEALSAAKCEECAALVGVTGRDECNLIACQLAKRVYYVKKTVARVNNPKNAAVVKQLGVDIAISSTDNITRLLEREIETSAIQQLMSLSADTSLTEIIIPEHFSYSGHTLADLTIPTDVIIISVTRNGEFIIPRGSTTINVGDKIVCLARDTAFHTLSETWRLQEND
ncbi:MAG: TrkA family potassium uptake protein [Oscillospiraceae bacterium]|nr:TrkA family potassium uptake protein [Oscillospiraceae bacterium]